MDKSEISLSKDSVKSAKSIYERYEQLISGLTPIESKAVAVFLGMAIGDSWGHLYEFTIVNYEGNKKIDNFITPR